MYFFEINTIKKKMVETEENVKKKIGNKNEK